MHTEVFNNIDTLINMANSPLNIDEINTELITLRKNIKTKQSEIEDLKSLMTDSRYFNASNELVDKNIEISLKNKINRLNRKIKAIKETITEIQNREKRVHSDITALDAKLNENATYLEVLETKVNSSTSNEYYKSLLNKEQESNNLLKKELENKNNLYNDILKELDLNNQAYNELTNKLTTEKNRLNDILDNLDNPNAYIDEDLKNTDNEKLATLNKELDALEKRKLELLTDANMIGADAKELIIDNDFTGALAKIKELVTIVKNTPYMDVTSMSILDEELEKKENMRDELSNLIDNKNYEELESDSLNNRLNYIKDSISKNNELAAKYQNEIDIADEYVNNVLANSITSLENEILTLEKSITEYHNLLKDNSKTPRVKANLESTITKKEKENNILNEILTAYKENLLAKIEYTNDLNALITHLKDENTNLNIELDKLTKLSLLDLTTKDYAREEEDKEELKKLNDEIAAIKNREQFTKTPDEIYDEIDMYLASINTPETLKVENNVSSKPEPERIKVVEIIPVETVKAETGGN